MDRKNQNKEANKFSINKFNNNNKIIINTFKCKKNLLIFHLKKISYKTPMKWNNFN